VLAQLKQDYESRGVYFVSLSIEKEDSREKVASWLRKAGAAGLTTGRASLSATERLHEVGGQEPGPVPANVYITPEGRVSRVMIGRASEAKMAEAIEAIAPK